MGQIPCSTERISCYLYLFWGTHLQVRRVYGFSRLMAQTTRTRARMCLFGDFFSHYSPFRGSTPLFWGLNRRFQAKLAKSKDMHIIKTTASIPTKFCTVIKTTKCPSWVVPTHITNARWRTAAILEKSKNCYISAMVWAILTKFGSRMQFDTLDWFHR